MKRILLLIVILALLAACGGSTLHSTVPLGTTENTQSSEIPSQVESIDDAEYNDYFIYQGIPVLNPADLTTKGEFITSFAVDENGNVYVAGLPYGKYNKIYTSIIAYGMDGSKHAEYEVETGDNISHFCVGDGMLYYTKWGENRDIALDTEGFYSFNLETGVQSKLSTPTNAFTLPDAVKKLVYRDGVIYILGVIEDYITDTYDDWHTVEGSDLISYNYQYDGRILAAYNIKTSTLEIVFNNLIQDFAPTPYGTLMLQIYDPEYDLSANHANSRFYFTELNPETMSIGERIYRDIFHPASFASDGHGVLFSANGGSGLVQIGNLYYWSLGDDAGISEVLGEGVSVQRNDAIAYCNGFTFYLAATAVNNRFESSIVRIRNSAYIEYTSQIEIIGANTFGELPRAGYNLNCSKLPYDDFALSVLSGASAYDVAYVGTQQDFAYNIQKKGSFYPLNDVPGVKEYLDACFPYVKEAATDKDGSIWMIPIEVSVDAIVYNEENCQTAGLDFANAATVDDIIRTVRTGAQYDSAGQNYVFDPKTLLQKSLLKYLRNNDTLDTSEFREMAPIVKDFVSERSSWGTYLPFLSADQTQNPQFLFDNVSLQTSSHLIERNDLYAAPITGKDGTSNSADCVFLCVNPKSVNLEKTLEYISAVCAYLAAKQDSRMLVKSPLFTGSDYAKRLYDLYANATIDFNLSDEVFADVFDRYLNDEISLDELIQEADRKLAMYRGE